MKQPGATSNSTAATGTDGEMSQQLCEMSAMIDTSPAYAHCDTETILWRRCTKAVQEIGEVMEALAGVVGENPRKGVTHTMDDVEAELLDVAVSALGAVAHLHDNACDVGVLLATHVRKIHARLEEATQSDAEAPTQRGCYLSEGGDADDVRTAPEGGAEKLRPVAPQP